MLQQYGDGQDSSRKTREHIEAKLSRRHEATIKRERTLAYAFTHQVTTQTSFSLTRQQNFPQRKRMISGLVNTNFKTRRRWRGVVMESHAHRVYYAFLCKSIFINRVNKLLNDQAGVYVPSFLTTKNVLLIHQLIKFWFFFNMFSSLLYCVHRDINGSCPLEIASFTCFNLQSSCWENKRIQQLSLFTQLNGRLDSMSMSYEQLIFVQDNTLKLFISSFM